MRLELTQRSAYAVRAMVCLAGSAGDGVISSGRIARANGISVRFLPQVMADLVKAGLVEARTGRKGGYRLARPPSEVSLRDVIEATRGDERAHVCVMRNDGHGPDPVGQAVHLVVVAAQEALSERLARTSLGDVCAASRALRCVESDAGRTTPAPARAAEHGREVG